MQINCIHDWNRKDRYELLQKEIAEHNLDVKIWDAVKTFSKPRQNIHAAHCQIVKWAKENNVTECLIAEDDFHITALNGFEFFLSKKPTEYDLYLSNIIWGRLNPDNTTSDFAGLNMYFIHQRYYTTFLESDPNRDIDRAQMRRGIFKVCVPFPVVQAETFSDNAKRIHKNAKLYLNKSIYDGTNG